MYSFGQTLSLPFYTETWRPDSWYPRLEENLRLGVHTLVLLDIKVREQSEENMARCVIFFCFSFTKVLQGYEFKLNTRELIVEDV